jgi:aminoglycoside phosphotransferase (APT) family kinase protein
VLDPGDPLGINVPRLEEWLSENVAGVRPPVVLSRLLGGHSCLTYRVTDAGGFAFVLRRPPLGDLLATAHDVTREHRIMRALAGRVPVPRMLGVCADPEVTGASFYVMELVDGLVAHTSAQASELLTSPESRRTASEELVDALAALHSTDPEAVDLGDLSRKGGYLERQLRRWSAQSAAGGIPRPEKMDRLYGWLLDNRPPEEEGRIVHGDFRLGNVILGASGSVRAVIDWELCTLGDPLADLAHFLRAWSIPDARTPDEAVVGSRPGFLKRADLVGRYQARTSRSLEDLDYWMAYTSWRAAAILAGVFRRYEAGELGDPPANLSTFPAEIEARIDQGLSFAAAAEPGGA